VQNEAQIATPPQVDFGKTCCWRWLSRCAALHGAGAARLQPVPALTAHVLDATGTLEPARAAGAGRQAGRV
jgi:uncharacterized membrane protein YgcG